MPSVGALIPCLRNKHNAMSVDPAPEAHGEPDIVTIHRTVHFGRVR